LDSHHRIPHILCDILLGIVPDFQKI